MSGLRELAEKATPGPWELRWPSGQGGVFTVWGRQGTPPDFADGWAIPLVATGVQSNMEWIAAVSPDVVLALLDVMEAAREWAVDDDADCECTLCSAIRALDRLPPAVRS